MSRHHPHSPNRFRHLLLVAAALPLLGGCMTIRSYDPKVAQAEPDDAFASASTEATDGGDAMDVSWSSSMPDGHFVASSQVTVIRPDARREAARFESRRGAKSFEEQVADRYARGDAVRERNTGGIPLFYAAEERRMLSENAFYNEQLEHADANHDGVVTDAEVRAYAHAEPRNERR